MKGNLRMLTINPGLRALMIAMLLQSAPQAIAHPGHQHGYESATEQSAAQDSPLERTWRVSDNETPFRASLVLATNDRVSLQLSDGSVASHAIADLAVSDQRWTQQRQFQIRQLNTEPAIRLVSTQADGGQPTSTTRPLLAGYFDRFKPKVGVRWDERFLYVESNGLPDHDMLVGITAWQQQVPLPQPFTGANAWRIPLHPVPARKPMSAKENFFIGAIAIAVNGVPIFNPIKTGGRVDTFLAGELDQWGGHAGRADDYHYHIAPVHLEKIVGKGNPIAVALDGYPIYGYEDQDGSKRKLDWLGGHKDEDGNYHYHATKTYPYVNGGFYGEVDERNGHVEPQARGQHLRGDARTPLRGAKVTGFDHPDPDSYRVEYEVYGEKRSIDYKLADDGSAVFTYTDPSGSTIREYEPGKRGRGLGTIRPGQPSLAGPPERRRAAPPSDRSQSGRRPRGERSRGPRGNRPR